MQSRFVFYILLFYELFCTKSINRIIQKISAIGVHTMPTSHSKNARKDIFAKPKLSKIIAPHQIKTGVLHQPTLFTSCNLRIVIDKFGTKDTKLYNPLKMSEIFTHNILMIILNRINHQKAGRGVLPSKSFHFFHPSR